MRRPLLLAAATLLATACTTSASPPPSPSSSAVAASAEPSVSPSPSPSPASSPSPEPSPSPGPSPSPVRSPSASVKPPGVTAFWKAVADAMTEARTVTVDVAGPSPGELRYERTASATAIEGDVTFVCRGGRAYDGQSGWQTVPGSWSCGPTALVRGFRSIGQPLDAWNATLPQDRSIREAIDTTSGGRYRWTYRASSPFSGAVTTRVVIDPDSGRIVQATRTDGTGETTYRVRYSADFPAIAVP